MPWKVKTWEFKTDATFDVAPKEAKASAEVSYRSKKGADASMDLDVKIVDISASADLTTVRAETEYGNGLGIVGLEGPKAGVDCGIKYGVKDGGASAMVEGSLAKASASLGCLYGEVGLNANTGIKFGSQGFKLNVLGFGVTLGVNGKYTFDTPVGSVGGCDAVALKLANSEEITVKGYGRRTQAENLLTY